MRLISSDGAREPGMSRSASSTYGRPPKSFCSRVKFTESTFTPVAAPVALPVVYSAELTTAPCPGCEPRYTASTVGGLSGSRILQPA
jgi:hypothetical protein